MDEVKPCPFCGCEDCTRQCDMSTGQAFVRCGKCGVEGRRHLIWPKALKAWNTRAGSAPSSNTGGSEIGNHLEGRCGRCGGKNPTWFTPNEIFNKVNGSPNGIICPACFQEMADAMGINTICKVDVVPSPVSTARKMLTDEDIDRMCNEKRDVLMREFSLDKLDADELVSEFRDGLIAARQFYESKPEGADATPPNREGGEDMSNGCSCGVADGFEHKEWCGAEIWQCDACGEQFYVETFSHAVPGHSPDCDGQCRNCPVPVECGPVTRYPYTPTPPNREGDAE